MINKSTKTNLKCKELFDSTANLFEKVIRLLPLTNKEVKRFCYIRSIYTYRLLKRISCNGIKYALNEFKELKRICTCIATGEEYSYSLRGLHPSLIGDYPAYLDLLASSLKGSAVHKRVALTIANVTNLLHLQVDNDLEQITGLSTATNLESICADFDEFILKCDILKPVDEQVLPMYAMEPYVSFRKGPNGISSLSLLFDYVALKNDPLLGSSVSELLEITSPDIHKRFVDYANQDTSKLSSRVCQHSKISQISEKAGKTRKIAIIDGWSQSALKPIHNCVYGILESIHCDGTFDQFACFSLAVKMANELGTSYSYDLSSATDRFPIELQLCVMRRLFGDRVAGLWAKVIKDRDFSIKMSGHGNVTEIRHGVRWKVGQPLGALSSWGVFALTHHLFIKFCASDPKYNKYVILGDDIQIFNSEVARKYVATMLACGVQIALPKSFVTQGPIVHGEFCKRIYLGNDELSPIPSSTLLSVVKDFTALPSLIEEIVERWNVPLGLCLDHFRDFDFGPGVSRRRVHVTLGLLGSRGAISGFEPAVFAYPLDLVFRDACDFKVTMSKVLLELAAKVLKTLVEPLRQLYTECEEEVSSSGSSTGFNPYNWDSDDDDEPPKQSFPDRKGATAEFSNKLLEVYASLRTHRFLQLKKVFFQRYAKRVGGKYVDLSDGDREILECVWKVINSRCNEEPISVAFGHQETLVNRLADMLIFPKAEEIESGSLYNGGLYVPDYTLVQSISRRQVADPKAKPRLVDSLVGKVITKCFSRLPDRFSDEYFRRLEDLSPP